MNVVQMSATSADARNASAAAASFASFLHHLHSRVQDASAIYKRRYVDYLIQQSTTQDVTTDNKKKILNSKL
jgi:hypothetical protein